MEEFKIMAMKPGDKVAVTGYYADPFEVGTVDGWARGGSYGASWTVWVMVNGERREFGHGGDRPHTFWH